MLVAYFAVTLVQVWLTSRHYDPHQAGAILVMGAAQYNGVPSPDLEARLNQALKLYNEHDARLIMLTGSKEPGDVYTEAESGAMYLERRGCRGRHPRGRRGQQLREHRGGRRRSCSSGITSVLVTTDPFHEDRSMAIASQQGLTPSPTPTQTRPSRAGPPCPTS